MADYRQVGGRLGAYIRTTKPTTQQIQGLLSDLLAGDELLSTMRDVVSTSSFKVLQELAGSGDGAVQRDAFLSELARRYLPTVVDEVGQLINGMLDQPAGKTIYDTSSRQLPTLIADQGEDQETTPSGIPEKAEQYLNNLRKPKQPKFKTRLEGLIHKSYTEKRPAPRYFENLRDPKPTKIAQDRPIKNLKIDHLMLRHIETPFVVAAFVIGLAFVVQRYTSPEPGGQNTKEGYRAYNCAVQRETLTRKAMDLPSYIDINNKQIGVDDAGMAITPWQFGGQTWQSVVSDLTINHPPDSLSGQQEDRIHLAKIYDAECS